MPLPGTNTKTFTQRVKNQELKIDDNGQLIDKGGQPIPVHTSIHAWGFLTYDSDRKKFAFLAGNGLGRYFLGGEKLMDKGNRRTAEEDAALELMVSLVRTYEEQHYPLPKFTPREMLVYLMEQRKLKQADLVPIFKSRGYVSDVINGKRSISKAHAKELAEFFKLSADLFV